jgi:ABC-type spermidine/putrescine transport system permease subunit I
VRSVLSRAFRRADALLPAPLVPATVVMIVLMLLPLLVLFSYSVFEVDGVELGGGPSLATYASIIGDPYFWGLFGRTFLIALTVTALCLAIGYPLAWLIARTSGWKRAALLIAVAAPLLTSALVRTFAWIVILGGQGLVSETLQGVGAIDEPRSFLFEVGAVILGMTQVMLPFMVVPLISAISDVPDDTQQAAENLGAGFARTFWTVLVPQTLPGIGAGVTLVFALSYSEFTVAVLLGGGAFNYASIYVYDAMTALLEWGRGAAVASLMLVTSLVFIVALNAFLRRWTRWSRPA